MTEKVSMRTPKNKTLVLYSELCDELVLISNKTKLTNMSDFFNENIYSWTFESKEGTHVTWTFNNLSYVKFNYVFIGEL